MGKAASCNDRPSGERSQDMRHLFMRWISVESCADDIERFSQQIMLKIVVKTSDININLMESSFKGGNELQES